MKIDPVGGKVFRYIKGVRFWQITEWLPRKVRVVLMHPHHGPLIVGMVLTMATGVLGLLAFMYVGRSGMIRFDEGFFNEGTFLFVILGTTLPLLVFFFGLLQFPVFMETRMRIRNRILDGDREFRPFLMREQDPIFNLIMPPWLVDRYLKDLKREDVPIRIKNALLDYYLKAVAIEQDFKQVAGSAEDRVDQIEAMYQYVVRLTQLAQSYTPVFEQELGVIYGLEYFDDRYVFYRKERDAQLNAIKEAVVEVNNMINKIANGYKTMGDRVSVMLAE